MYSSYPPPPPPPAAADGGRATYGGAPPVAEFQQMNLGGGSGRVICGPLLRYIETDYRTGTYRGSCLIVSDHRQAPPLEIRLQPLNGSSGPTQKLSVQGELLDVFRNEFHFWRYELRLPFQENEQLAVYTSPCLKESYSFHIPGYYQSMRFMFHSCNGFSDIPQETKDRFGEKDAPLWQDVLDRHNVMPFHVLLGGGDQLYQDRLIHEDFMKPWNDEKDPKKRVAMVLPKETKEGLEHFYFYNYVKNFG